jgi:sugar phosphate isomerase/epimerase
MSRCFSSLGCPELTLAQVQALAERFGIDAVELRALEGSVDLPAVFRLRYGSPAALADQRGPVPVIGLGTSVAALSSTEADLDVLAAYAAWAEALGARWLRVFDGGHSASAPELDRAQTLLGRWQDMRLQRGWSVDLVVETHDALITEATLQNFRRALPNAALLWDAHHTWRKGGVQPRALWPMIADAVAHIHVKDSVGTAQSYQYVLPGDGAFPIAQISAIVSDVPQPLMVSLEWERLWHRELPALELALAQAARVAWW